VVESGVAGPAPGCGLPVDAGSTGEAVPGGWAAADGWAAVEWALQPVTAMAAANTTAAMILAGRMATPSEQARLYVSQGHELGLGRSRADDGRVARSARKDLDLVAIVNRNELTPGEDQGGSATGCYPVRVSGAPLIGLAAGPVVNEPAVDALQAWTKPKRGSQPAKGCVPVGSTSPSSRAG
jgi:hypothetical protein